MTDSIAGLTLPTPAIVNEEEAKASLESRKSILGAKAFEAEQLAQKKRQDAIDAGQTHADQMNGASTEDMRKAFAEGEAFKNAVATETAKIEAQQAPAQTSTPPADTSAGTPPPVIVTDADTKQKNKTASPPAEPPQT